jgi:hypothetical protein
MSPALFPLNAHNDEAGTLFDGNSKDFVSHVADYHACAKTVRIQRREQGPELPFGLCAETLIIRRMWNFVTEGVADGFDSQGKGLPNTGQMRTCHHRHIDDMEESELSSQRITQFDCVPHSYPRCA